MDGPLEKRFSPGLSVRGQVHVQREDVRPQRRVVQLGIQPIPPRGRQPHGQAGDRGPVQADRFRSKQ